MTPTEADYWRFSLYSAWHDHIPFERVVEAAGIAETGQQFDAAISATTRLMEIAEEAADAAYLSRCR